jgi:hypothetical protein
MRKKIVRPVMLIVIIVVGILANGFLKRPKKQI